MVKENRSKGIEDGCGDHDDCIWLASRNIWLDHGTGIAGLDRHARSLGLGLGW
jgi:hypothetical protein